MPMPASVQAQAEMATRARPAATTNRSRRCVVSITDAHPMRPPRLARAGAPGHAARCRRDAGDFPYRADGPQSLSWPLGTGGHLGELALIGGGPHSATVTATTDPVCYGVTFWEFRPLVERNATIRWKLL